MLSLSVPKNVNCSFGLFSTIILLVIAFQLHTFAGTSRAADVVLEWDEPAASSSVSGYILYYGATSQNYTMSLDVGSTTTYSIHDLPEGSTYYFAITSYDACGNQSNYSNEISYTVPLNVSVATDTGDTSTPITDVNPTPVTDVNPTPVTDVTSSITDPTPSTGAGSTDAYPTPVSDFRATVTQGYAPLSVAFTDLSSGSVTGRAWSFGDGGTSTEQNPTHIYSSAGSYTVTLTTTGPGGSDIETKNSYIIVRGTEDVSGINVWQDWFAVDSKETPMVGDFNGDGMTDIITFTRDNPDAVGDVYVALSEGNRFGENTFWNDWFAINNDETVVIGDFNGDGMDDIATWLGKGSRQVYVAASYGYGMDTAAVWLGGIGSSEDDVLKCGDVDGDGLVDLVLFARQEGKVYVARSVGDGFAAPTVWHNWFAVSAYERPEVGDVDGDGMVDIITFATDSPTAQGDVFVALSTGNAFDDGSASEKWQDWFSVDPEQIVRVGDLDGDGRVDFITFMPSPSGQVYLSYSEGSYLSDNILWTEEFAPSGSDLPFTGDVNGDGRDDLIGFYQGEGKVYVLLSP